MTEAQTKKKSNVRIMAATALMAAVCCVLGPVSVPIGPVPISLGLVAVFLCAYVLGAKNGACACLIYILLGACGLPVFSGFSGGFQKIAGPTGGYIVGFIFTVIISGLFIEKNEVPVKDGFRLKENGKNFLMHFAGMLAGLAVCYLFGSFWFMLINGGTLLYVLSVCVFPFIAFDIIKIIVCFILGNIIRTRLRMAGLI